MNLSLLYQNWIYLKL